MKFYLFIMPGFAVFLMFYICVPVFSYSSDVTFLMERHPDNDFCAHLQCVADVTHSDHDVSSLVEMTIYDITRINADLKLASVSRFHPDLYVDTTKSSAMSCTGIISRLQANLTVQLRHDIDCLYGVYKCKLDLVTASGHSEMLTEILTPEFNQNYSRMGETISYFFRLTELLNSHTVQVNNQTAQINRLASQADNQTALLYRLVNLLDDQTAQINRLASQADNQTALLYRLVNLLDDQTVQINRLASQSDNQTVLMNALASQLDNQTAAQLTYQKAQLNISSRLDLGQSEQNNLHEIIQEKLNKFEVKLDSVEQLSNQTVKLFHDQSTCIKGQLDISGPRKTVWLGDIPVLCDTITDGGGWILIQRRTKGDVDFYRNWADYKNGFGTRYTDFWIGNDVIHNLTLKGFNELRVDLMYQGKQIFAHYSNFSIGSESVNYRLSVSGYSGTAGDSLKEHNNMDFSTNDRDNDKYSENCAVSFTGAWWYNNCHFSNLNGKWGQPSNKGLRWSSFTGSNSATSTEMKIRRG